MRIYYAFSLVELIISMILIGILAIFITPRFLERSEFEKQVYLIELIDSLRFAQSQALSTGCDVKVEIKNRKYQLSFRENCDPSKDFSILIPANSYFNQTAPSSISSVSASEQSFFFDSVGRAKIVTDGSISNITIHLDDTVVTVVGETGFTYKAS